jgi:hypothetical protein
MKIIRTPTAAILAAAFFLAAQMRGENAKTNIADNVRLEAERMETVKELFFKGDSALPELARCLSMLPCDSRCHAEIQYYLCCGSDGLDMLSEGKPAPLSITRNLLARQSEQNKLFLNASTTFGLVYLAQKGDARDLDVMRRMLAVPAITNNTYLLNEAVGLPYKILQMRAAGTNAVALDTRTLAAGDCGPAAVDVRGLTQDLSGDILLNTKKSLGTMLLLR